MSNSTLPLPRLHFIGSILLTLLFGIRSLAQEGFFKVFPSSEYQAIKDLLVVNEKANVFVTTNYFYILDGSGNVKIKKEFKQGIYSELESVIRDSESNFWISSVVFDNLSTSRKVLYKLNGNGDLQATISINDPAPFELTKLVPAADARFFLSYKARSENGKAAVRVALMDKTGNKLWEKQATDTIYNNYTIKTGPNNSADIFFQHTGTRQGEIVNIDDLGNINKQTIKLTEPQNLNYYTADFVRLPDGFVFAGAALPSQPFYNDGLLYKTDENGDPVWVKKININLGDEFYNIARTTNGFVVLGISGTTTLGNDNEGDIILLKTDESGNEIWTRAFGGAKMDYARHLRVLNQHILFAGQSSYAGQTVGIPAVCLTDANGEIPSSLPFQPEPYSLMKILDGLPDAQSSRLIQSVPGASATLIGGGNMRILNEDASYPFVVKYDKDGTQVWHKRLSDYAATFVLLRQIRPNEYIAVTEIKDLFQNWYDVYLLNENGEIVWKKNLQAGAIKDVIATRDGGMLFTGSMDISFINYETVLVKLDASGNIEWQKTIGDQFLWETGRRIIETPEQNFLIVGNVQKEFDIVSSLYLLKIDRHGNKLWSRSIAEGITTDIGYNVVMTPDQGFLFIGSSNKQPFTDKNVLLIKTNQDGLTEWKKSLNIHLMDEGLQIINSPGSGFLLTGTTAEPPGGVLEKFVYVMRLDGSGNRTGVNYFGKSGLQTMNPCLTVLSSGDTILTGTTQQEYGAEQMFMVKLNGFLPTEESLETSLKIYPNPSNGSSSLVVDHPATGPVRIIIYDSYGRRIKSINSTKNNFHYSQDISITGASAGVYYINIWLNEKLSTLKWLVTP